MDSTATSVMATTTDLAAFKLYSLDILKKGLSGQITGTIFSVVGLCMCAVQMTTIVCYRPLRKSKQVSVINATVADALKAIACIYMNSMKAYHAIVGIDDVWGQLDCMGFAWLFCFSMLHGYTSVLALSTERLVAIAWPIWYKYHKNRFLWGQAAVSVAVPLISSMGMFINVTNHKLLASCYLASSTTPQYAQFLTISQATFSVAIILVNLGTSLMLLKRWRTALKAQTDMKIFKKEVNFSAIKAVFGVVILCLVSNFAGMIFFAKVQEMQDFAQRFLYAPFWGSFLLVRGMFDYGLWLIFSQKYREAFAVVFLRGRCGKKNLVGSTKTIAVTSTADVKHADEHADAQHS